MLGPGLRERLVFAVAVAYLTHPEDHSATIVDLEEGKVVATFGTGRRPEGIAWAPKSKR